MHDATNAWDDIDGLMLEPEREAVKDSIVKRPQGPGRQETLEEK